MDLKISNVALFTELALIGTGALNGRGGGERKESLLISPFGNQAYLKGQCPDYVHAWASSVFIKKTIERSYWRDKISFRPAPPIACEPSDSEPYFNWSFPHFRLTPFVCHVLGKTSSSFWKPSVVCCEDGSTNTVMTDTNNGRLMMTTNTLALYQNVPGESVESVNGV